MGGYCAWWNGPGRGRSKQPETLEELLDRCVVCPSGCYLFIGGESGNGYGRILKPGTRNMMAAHRYVHEKFIGPIPPGHDVDHLCAGWADTLRGIYLSRRCVRPEHLEAVPIIENQRRKIERRTKFAAKFLEPAQIIRADEFDDDPLQDRWMCKA